MKKKYYLSQQESISGTVFAFAAFALIDVQ